MLGELNCADFLPYDGIYTGIVEIEIKSAD